MKVVHTLLILWGMVFLVPAGALAQPDILWSHTFGGSYNDNCHSVQQTTDGGYILGGDTYSYGAGLYDFWLVKTDASGTEEWNRTFGGINNDYCHSIQQTSDGGYILGGTTESYGVGYGDFWLVKTDASGTEEWNRTFGDSSSDVCYSVKQTSDGGYILGGRTRSYGAGNMDFWLVKTDASGIEEWSRTFGGSDDDKCRSVQQTSDGGYILGGTTESYGVGYGDFWLVKTDASGTEEWNRTFGDSSSDVCYSVKQTSDGGYILGGDKTFVAGTNNFWLVKTDATGTEEWSRTFGGGGLETCLSIQQTTDGGYILGGYTSTFAVRSHDFWLVKTDANGDSLWNLTFGGSGNDQCHSVQQTSDGGYILGGHTSPYAGYDDYSLVKTGPELAADPIISPLPDKYALHQNYPNPFNPQTTIRFDLPKAALVNLRVFNILGREVAVLADGVQPAGRHSITFDGSSLPSGIYFYNLQAGEFTATQKMVLLK